MRRTILATLVVCLLFPQFASANCTFGLLSEVESPTGDNPGRFTVADFNGDTYPDVAAVRLQSGSVAILLGTGTATFQAPTLVDVIYVVSGIGGITSADLNSDGDMDLIVLAGGKTMVRLGNGDGTFTAGDDEQVGQQADIVSGDFNSDGNLDFAVSRQNSAGFNLLLGDGAGNITQKSLNDVPKDPGPGAWVDGIAAGDFDDDGKLDVAVSDMINDKVWVYFGIGDGTFTRSLTPIVTTTEPDHQPGSLVSADFNGDGNADLAVANFDPYGNVAAPSLSIVLSNGDRTFASPVPYGSISQSRQVITHDVDGDSILDVLVAGSYQLYVFRGLGNGTFATQTPINTGGGNLGLGILDADRDGGADVAVSHHSDDTIGVFLNTCGQVNLELISSANPASHGNSFTITTSLTSNPGATGTLTLSRTGGGTLGSTNLSAATGVSATQMLPIGTYEYVATYSGDSRFSAATRTLIQTVQTAPFGPPPGLVATSTGGSVQLTWYATSGTAKYEIWRQGSLGSFQVGETTNTFFTDDAPPSSAFVYWVRAISPTNIASDNSSDFTITHAFTDENIIAGATLVKGVHMTEVRNAANALRSLAGVPAAAWTSSTVVLAAQFNEVRTAINQARTALGFSAATFTDTLTPGVAIKGIHMMELRAAMR